MQGASDLGCARRSSRRNHPRLPSQLLQNEQLRSQQLLQRLLLLRQQRRQQQQLEHRRRSHLPPRPHRLRLQLRIRWRLLGQSPYPPASRGSCPKVASALKSFGGHSPSSSRRVAHLKVVLARLRHLLPNMARALAQIQRHLIQGPRSKHRRHWGRQLTSGLPKNVMQRNGGKNFATNQVART